MCTAYTVTAWTHAIPHLYVISPLTYTSANTMLTQKMGESMCKAFIVNSILVPIPPPSHPTSHSLSGISRDHIEIPENRGGREVYANNICDINGWLGSVESNITPHTIRGIQSYTTDITSEGEKGVRKGWVTNTSPTQVGPRHKGHALRVVALYLWLCPIHTHSMHTHTHTDPPPPLPL